MANVRIVVGDCKAGRCFQKEIDSTPFLSRKIGDKIKGDSFGLDGYELEITGGSDKAGFPMRKDLAITGKRKLLLTKGTGANIKQEGGRERKTVAGNTIGDNIIQVNLKVISYGKKTVHEGLGVEVKPTKKEQREAEKKAKAEAVKPAEEKQEA